MPLMVAVLKMARDDPALLRADVRVDQALPVPTNELGDDQRVLPGKAYSIDKLLHLMIAYSDNGAATLLDGYLNGIAPPRQPYREVFDDLGIRLARAEGVDQITVKAYASFLRQLYNAGYLGRDMSERALALLSASRFREGIVAGLPAEMQGAHKYGIVNIEGSDSKQLHDCGIVYHPLRPYLLCVMTRGTDMTQLAGAVREISWRVYREIDKHAHTSGSGAPSLGR